MNDDLQFDKNGIDLTKMSEGLRLEAYQDSVGVWTIGYGHTAGVYPGQRVTEEEAIQLLRDDVRWAEKGVKTFVKVPLTQNQYDALVDFAFNLGIGALRDSTLLRKLNAGDYEGAANEFRRWNKAGGKELPGLTRRRLAEAELFLR